MSIGSSAMFLILLFQLVSYAAGYTLVEKVSSVVNEGDTKVYYTEPREGGKVSPILLLCLDSSEGDADLYVSYSQSRPDYEHHDVSATSTGVDILVVSPQRGRIYMGVYGHVRHNFSTFNLYILSPNEKEIREHQVWEYNHVTQNEQLIIDVDPLFLANDPILHMTIEALKGGRVHPSLDMNYEEGVSWLRTTAEWIVWVLAKLIEIGVEIAL